MEIKNGKIEGVKLGFEYHGILTAGLTVVFGEGGTGASMGGLSLGGEFTDLYIRKLMNTLDVDDWSKIDGTFVRGKIDDSNRLIAIGHIMKDKWFNQEELGEKFRNGKNNKNKTTE